MKDKWILVADGERAKILRKEGNSLVPVEPTHHSDDVETSKDKGHHQPGPMSQGGNPAQHVNVTHTDWHKFDRVLFAGEICKHLNGLVGQFEQLVLIAPPFVLGELRKHLHAQVMAKVVLQIDKDLTKSPLNDLLPYING